MKLALVSMVTAFVLVAGPAAATGRPILVVGFAKIGSFKVQGGTPASARAAFGKPTAVKPRTDSCTMAWPGIEIGFYTLLDKPQCAAGTPFGSATVTRPWVTDRGLRQGRGRGGEAATRPPGRAERLDDRPRRPGSRRRSASTGYGRGSRTAA